MRAAEGVQIWPSCRTRGLRDSGRPEGSAQLEKRTADVGRVLRFEVLELGFRGFVGLGFTILGFSV